MAQKDPPTPSDDAGLKRLAMGVFLQLPPDLEEAAQVLAHCQEILKWHRGVPYQWTESAMECASPGIEGEVVAFTRRG